MGLETIKELIIERNCDVVPYFKFICNKFGRINSKRVGRYAVDDARSTGSSRGG